MSQDSPLSDLLNGIRAQHGSLVRCRDASAYEMALRLNRDNNGALLTAVLGPQEPLPAPLDGSADGQNDVEAVRCVDGGFLFVHEVHRRWFKEEMQQWLDPFSTQTVRGSRGQAQKHSRANESGSDNSESSSVPSEDEAEDNLI